MKKFNFALIKWRQWCGIPTAFFLFGMLSVVLFMRIERTDEKLQNNSNIIEAIMRIQIHLATFHIRLEESLYGYDPIDSKKIFDSLDQAIKLADVTLTGGEAEHELLIEPLRDRRLRDRAEAIKSLLIKFKGYGLERLQNREKSGTGSLIENRFETAFNEILIKSSELESILKKDDARDRKKSESLFFAILLIWVSLVLAATIGFGISEKKQKKAEEHLLKSNEQLLTYTEELTQHRERLSDLVGKRTAELITANKLLTEEINERKHTERVLRETETRVREISSELLDAQEIERRRISMELHDDLGQTLNVMKLHLRFIEKRLNENQVEIRGECEELLAFMDQLIEDVRRLSHNLSPTVLEDIGLTASLQWLTINLTKNPDMKVTSDIAEIDDLIHAKNRIVIYRVIQEALTNILKHAQAENVFFVVQRCDDKVIFLIEDDGRGFDLESSSIKDISDQGFGLKTMNERVSTIDGFFELWSQKGMGTRIIISVPVTDKTQEMGNRT